MECRGSCVRISGRLDPSPRYQRGVDDPNLLMDVYSARQNGMRRL
jgi:hypothetical protein